MILFPWKEMVSVTIFQLPTNLISKIKVLLVSTFEGVDGVTLVLLHETIVMANTVTIAIK